jgi:hypothetical protein
MAPASRSEHQYFPEVPKAFASWLASGNYDWFLTAVVEDGGGTPDRLRYALRHARNVAQRGRLGPRWAKRRDRHMTGFYVIEGLPAGNGHVHAALRFDVDDSASFERSMDAGWRRKVYQGNVVIKPFNPDIHHSYIVKELSDPRAEELWGFVQDL